MFREGAILFSSLNQKNLFIKWYIAFQESFYPFWRTEWSVVFK